MVGFRPGRGTAIYGLYRYVYGFGSRRGYHFPFESNQLAEDFSLD